MSIDEQKSIKEDAYNEAMRYMSNARETLKSAQKEGRLYFDVKYVRTAAGTAYNGVLLALDAWLKTKDVPMPKARKKSIEWYTKEVSKKDKKLNVALKAVYDSLHLAGYYDGNPSVGNMESGLDIAEDIISRIKL